MTLGHGGNIYEVARQYNCRPSDIIDMSSNMNPLGPPPGLLEFLNDNMSKITRTFCELMGAKLKALTNDADLKSARERIAC